MATAPNWVEEEFERRARGPEPRPDEAARESRFQSAVLRLWEQLGRELQDDADDFRKLGGVAQFSQAGPDQCRIDAHSLALLLSVDFAAHNIHYEYQSLNARTAAPEGGIFSVRLSRYGRPVLYSADERLTLEEARRMLLEPIFFPTAPLD